MSVGTASPLVSMAPSPSKLLSLIIELASELARIDAVALESRMEQSLSLIGDYTGADAVCLLRFVEPRSDGAVARIGHAWGRQASRTVPNASALPLLTASLTKLQGGEAIQFAGLAAIPHDLLEERGVYEGLGVESLCAEPLRWGGDRLGALVLASFSGRDDFSTRHTREVRALAGLFAGALQRVPEPRGLRTRTETEPETRTSDDVAIGAGTLAEVDRAHILSVLRACHWVVAGPHGAAARLGMKRSTLNFRMSKLGIVRERA